MKFCDDCGPLMTSQGGAWACPNGHEKARDSEKEKPIVATGGQKPNEVVDMPDVDNADIGPTTKVTCPKCGHDVARYEMKQICSADESETRLFTCVERDHKWREDDR